MFLTAQKRVGHGQIWLVAPTMHNCEVISCPNMAGIWTQRCPIDAHFFVSLQEYSKKVPNCATQNITCRFRMHQVRCSIVVSISACHAEDPGSIPGGGRFVNVGSSPTAVNLFRVIVMKADLATWASKSGHSHQIVHMGQLPGLKCNASETERLIFWESGQDST